MSAVLSPCLTYRYRLDRDCDPAFKLKQDLSFTFAYFGINPSTADADLDDATVRKWRGFTERNGGSRFIVGNVFSLRATDVKAIDRANREHIQVRGPDHMHYMQQIIAEADFLIPCWGRSSKVDRNIRPLIGETLDLILSSGKPVLHFGKNNDGTPRHPLMLPYSTPLSPWRE